MRTIRIFSRECRGLSMVEFVMALVILSVLMIGVGSAVMGTVNVQRYTQSQGSASAEVDAALRRIIYNIRTAAAAPVWGTFNSANALQLTHTGVTGTIAYYLDTNGNLVEYDARYNVSSVPNPIVHGVGTGHFSCTIASPSASQQSTLVTISLTVPTLPAVVRTVIVGARGF